MQLNIVQLYGLGVKHGRCVYVEIFLNAWPNNFERFLISHFSIIIAYSIILHSAFFWRYAPVRRTGTFSKLWIIIYFTFTRRVGVNILTPSKRACRPVLYFAITNHKSYLHIENEHPQPETSLGSHNVRTHHKSVPAPIFYKKSTDSKIIALKYMIWTINCII